jgi:hypothetical protein
MIRGRTMKRTLTGVLLVLVLAGVAVAGFSYHEAVQALSFQETVARTRERIARHEKEFTNDQAYVASLPLFAHRNGTRDAGPLIGPRVHWIRMKPGAVDYPAISDLAIDRGLSDKLGKDWLNASPELWRGLDFGWMAQLADCDYWDVERNSASDPSDLKGPEPFGSDLSAWAMLRLAKGLHENALSSAIAEVRELARLCFTTERLDSGLHGIALLAQVRRAQETAKGQPDGIELQRIQRALWGAYAFTRIETPPEYARYFDRLAVGRCVGLHDGAWGALVIRAELRDARPEEYRRLELLLARAPECRLGRIREKWALSDAPPERRATWWERTLWRWSPAWRRSQVETLVAIGAQDWFKGYDRDRPAK